MPCFTAPSYRHDNKSAHRYGVRLHVRAFVRRKAKSGQVFLCTLKVWALEPKITGVHWKYGQKREVYEYFPSENEFRLMNLLAILTNLGILISFLTLEASIQNSMVICI